MSSFSIDDVRDSFRADVSLFLTRIRQGAEAALAAPVLGTDALEGTRRPVFTPIGEHGHAIYGTAALVGARSLHESAQALEELARAGEEAIAQLDEARKRARAIAAACIEGVTQMRRMLLIELDHRSDDAVKLSAQWMSGVSSLRQRPPTPPAEMAAGSAQPGPQDQQAALPPKQVPQVPAAPAAAVPPAPAPAAAARSAPPVAPAEASGPPAAEAAGEPSSGSGPGPEDVFQFESEVEDLPIDEEPAALQSRAGFHFEDADQASGFGGELQEVFHKEGEIAVRAMAVEMALLRAQPGDTNAVSNLERLFHTLKGAAATVGLAEISAAAASIQERLEEELERGVKLTPEAVEALDRDIAEVLVRAGLPPLSEAAPGAPAPGAAASAHVFFLEEAGDLQRQAHGLLETLASESAEKVARARQELGALFHRLKGSAYLVGELRVGGEAEKLQALLDPEAAGTGSGAQAPEDLAPTIRAALARISALLGTDEAVGAAAAEPVQEKPVRETVTVATEPELWNAFTQESGELMDSLERECLALEESAQPRQGLERAMNMLHTLKGVLNTIGLAPTAKILHRVEDFVENLLGAPILPPMRSVASLLLKVRGDVRKNLNEAKQGYVETAPKRLEARIARVLQASRGKAEAPPPPAAPGPREGHKPARSEGASIHSIAEARSHRSGVSVVSARGSMSRMAPGDPADRKFIRVGTERLDALMNLAGELVVSRSRLLARVGTLWKLQQELGRRSRSLLETVDEFRDTYEYASLDGRTVSPVRAAFAQTSLAAGSVSAPAGVADAAAQGHSDWGHFGELELDRYDDIHILSRRLAEIVSDVTELSGDLSHGLTSFSDDSQALDTIVTGIQTEVSRARMVPLDILFSRLRLPVRDAAGRDSKEVRVATEGADVTIDKTIADGLFGPMLHLVRNAVVHGIEPAAARQASGKPLVGVITLSARQESGQIVVEIRDDGGGLDLPGLRARGAQLNLVPADLPLDDPALCELVFVPGLSTDARAGAVSGRGLGCDIVRRAVERMNGTIQVESKTGEGATFTITLPVTLAITKALLVRQNGRAFAFPLHFAERILDVEDNTIVESAGVRRIKIEEQFITVTPFDRHLRTPGPETRKGPILLLRVGDQRAAVQVDAIVGQEEIVVKSLGDVLSGHPLFAGVTMRGTGELVLIVDVPALLETKAPRLERARPQAALPAAPVVRPEPKVIKPRPAVAAAAAATAAAPPPAAAPAKRRRARVLFVDDSLSVRKYAELTFASLGVDLTLAVDGVDALNRLRGETFDIVFTDLEMPRMHGFELIRELRFVPAYRDLPIVVVTSRSGQKHKQQALTLGATEYLTKPFSPQVVEEMVRRFTKPPGEGDPRPVPRGLPS
jgi:chemosensory pili system protein ChpA (sensor histidine kinase/response regulator)